MAFVTVEQLLSDKESRLHLKLVAGRQHLHGKITSPAVLRPGLALAGAAKKFKATEILVLGSSELQFLRTLEAKVRRQRIGELCQQGLSCIILCRGKRPARELLSQASRLKIAVLSSSLAATSLVERLTSVLQEHLSPSVVVHGVMVDILGVGVLLIGESGIGKSECALDLLLRGHRLVADDIVRLKKIGENNVLAGADEMIRGHMEIRGLGIIEITRILGSSALCEAKTVNLVIQLSEWTDAGGFERLGVEEKTYDVLGCNIPLVKLPIRTGRNIASIVEVAARNQLLKMRGYHPAIEFLRKHEEKIKTESARVKPKKRRAKQ